MNIDVKERGACKFAHNVFVARRGGMGRMQVKLYLFLAFAIN
jgi:hypothetical protein